MKTTVFTLVFFLTILQVSLAQEICDNNIDDDGDGLIDCLDNECLCNYCSSKQGNIWYFGNYAGLDFSTPTPTPLPLTLNSLAAIEGCGTISDPHGHLLFYTNGNNIWNREYNLMVNGSGLIGNPSSAQTGFIIKKPKSDSLYYVFTFDDAFGSGPIYYSIINMARDSSRGEVVSKNNLLTNFNITEKITAIQHCNNEDIWILTQEEASNNFHTWMLSDTGITAPSVQQIGSTANSAWGQIKASASGKKVAVANWLEQNFEVFDFDKSTGLLSNPITLSTGYGGAYSVEFSPNERFLYAEKSYASTIFQYDLSLASDTLIMDSVYVVHSFPQSYLMGGIQAAVDGKIYVSRFAGGAGSNRIPVISQPNQKGINCGFYLDSIILNANCSESFPQVFHSFLEKKENPSIIGPDTVCNNGDATFQLINPNKSCEANAITWTCKGNNTIKNYSDSSVTINTQTVGTDTLIVNTSNVCPNLLDTILIVVKNCTSINTIHSEQNIFDCLPNPFSSELNITTSNPVLHPIEKIQVLNLLGQPLGLFSIKSDNNIALDLSQIPSGVYIIQIKSKNQYFSKKVVKN